MAFDGALTSAQLLLFGYAVHGAAADIAAATCELRDLAATDDVAGRALFDKDAAWLASVVVLHEHGRCEPRPSWALPGVRAGVIEGRLADEPRCQHDMR